uniref:Uncharacterized protein n=1 Tax=Romanomermis culicivorax TaxID=13658 RepID=A0A915JNC5_ROMCU
MSPLRSRATDSIMPPTVDQITNNPCYLFRTIPQVLGLTLLLSLSPHFKIDYFMGSLIKYCTSKKVRDVIEIDYLISSKAAFAETPTATSCCSSASGYSLRGMPCTHHHH